MRLRRRILIAIILCLLLPLLAIAVVVVLILRFQVHLLSVSYNVKTDTFEVIQNSPSLFESLMRDDYNDLLETVRRNPALVTDPEWLAERNEGLAEKHSFLCFRVDGEIVYNGEPDFYSTLEAPLPDFREPDAERDQSVYLEGDSRALIRQIDIRGEDGSEQSLFFITDINHVLPQWKKTFFEVLIAMLVVLVITTLIVVRWLTRSVVVPLSTINEAANQISAGNLDCPLPVGKKDEIGRLQADFESMRVNLKEMSESRRRYEQDYHDMIASISHDLKTPLTAIRGYAEGLLDNVADTPEKRERYFRTIHTKATDMERMVEELTFFAKIEQRAMKYEFREMQVHGFLADCIEDLSLDLETRGVTISCEEHIPESLTAVFDPEHIKRVLVNIIGNSEKYMDKPDGRISVGVDEEDDFVRFSVTDNGCGIPASDMPYIFDRFYRGDASRGTKKGGNGIGLSIVKSIVSAHGGSVKASSAPGKWTTISFTLPRHSEQLPQSDDGNGGILWNRKISNPS